MRKHDKKEIEGIPHLFTFDKVKKHSFTITGMSILRLLSEHYTQSQIAVKLGTSKQVVHYWVIKLESLGLWINPKKPKVKKSHAGGIPPYPYDVRFRSLKWNLANPVKLPYDDRHILKNETEQQIWKVRDCLIRQNIGKKQFSLEIEAGFCGGKTKAECEHKHDAKVMRLFDWLKQHFPDLERFASSGFEINRPGELQIGELRPLAEQITQERGGGTIKLGDMAKIDQSRGYPEFQFLKELATKQEINEIKQELEGLKEGITIIATYQKETIQQLKELVKILGNKVPQEPENPGKPPGDIYG